MFSSFYPQELADFLATAQSVLDFISVAIVFITKICMCLLFWRFFHWKLSLVSYLMANVVGMQYLIWFFYKWARTSIYFFAYDTFWSSIIILIIWGGHELNLLDLPDIWRMLLQATHAMLDLTGDRKFDFQDIKVICGIVYNWTRQGLPILYRRVLFKITGQRMKFIAVEGNGHDKSSRCADTAFLEDPTETLLQSISAWKTSRSRTQRFDDDETNDNDTNANETKCEKCNKGGAATGLDRVRGEEQGTLHHKTRKRGLFEKMAGRKVY